MKERRLDSDRDHMVRDLCKPRYKVCGGFTLKSVGSYSKAFTGVEGWQQNQIWLQCNRDE